MTHKGTPSSRTAVVSMDLELKDHPEARISRVVVAMLRKKGHVGPIPVDQNLREAGLSSLELVNLMLAVEGEFDIFIPEDKMTPEHFRSIEAINALVGALVPAT